MNNTKYLLWEPPSSGLQAPMQLKVYMFFSDNNNQDFINFFNAIGRKLDKYNQLTANSNNPYLQNWPNNNNRLLLSILLEKYKTDNHGKDFCGDIMDTEYLKGSANDKKRMCIFITGTNPHPHNNSEERLHSAATVYFSTKTISSDSESSSASTVFTMKMEKVLNVEAICAAPRNYVTHNGGRRMMALLVGACREMSIKNIYLNAIDVQQTLDFYKSLGFKTTGETDDGGNIEHRHESGMSNSNINTANTSFAMKMATQLANDRKKRKRDVENVELKLAVETWTESYEQDLDEIGGVFASVQHLLYKQPAKIRKTGGSKKIKKKSKKRKSKARNSKTRARVF